ncbi:carboxy-S-adenosyl-L-methionine synthase CmoA [Algicola sagamiensis]|uniref:carboxy-S-adenosyl-L-methionine synthase CmoA n=1 Tax=Algicola sagamiensis TaxID=163869 RepID=UPI00036B3366|nr:carboxy-S-adenosyl-L-methionine synthase CmoA [Algicola sagamiensis]
MNSGTDTIFSKELQVVEDFSFDQSVVEVFPDMIQRSVPGYKTIISTIGKIAGQYAQDNSNVYDLGCSLGAATQSMRSTITADNCQIFAIDLSKDMVERCRIHLDGFKSDVPVHVSQGDVIEADIQNASIVILNFTLQFIQPHERDALITKIYQGMREGGILIVSEKLVFSDPHNHDLLTELHLDFKRAHGYSELEISQKRTALENVMIPDSREDHYTRFKTAGFTHVDTWYQCFNFCSMFAIK